MTKYVNPKKPICRLGLVLQEGEGGDVLARAKNVPIGNQTRIPSILFKSAANIGNTRDSSSII